MLRPVGGLVTILGFLLPFNENRSLFAIMDGTTLPLLPQLLLFAVVAAAILYRLDLFFVPTFISTLLLTLLCLFYFVLLTSCPISILIANLQIGAYLLPLGLLAMVLHPLFPSEPDKGPAVE